MIRNALNEWHAAAPVGLLRAVVQGVAGIIAASTAAAQAGPTASALPRPDAPAAAIRQWREQHEPQVVGELTTLLALTNSAADSVNIRRNANLIRGMLERRGVSARLLENGPWPPVVFGELRAPGATRTVMFYAHYDGQPVAPAEWASPPFQPALRSAPRSDGSLGPVKAGPVNGRYDPEDRIYARSASDDKAPIIAMLAALDAMQATGQKPDVNVKFFFEGEEEAGSAHLKPVLERNKALLAADVWMFCDGPAHQSRQLQLVFGVRGVMGVDATVYGPSRALHSGHYGNWAPNPGALVAELIGSLRDPDGRILVGGYYDDVVPPTPAELAAVRALPPVDDDLRRSLQIGATEAGNALLAERIMLPAINVRGIRVGQVGALANNAIATEAQASFDFRLVPNQQPAKVRERVEAHLAARGWHVVHAVPTAAERLAHARVVRLEWEGGYPAYRTSVEQPVAVALRRVASGTAGREILMLPTLGGSIGMQEFYDVLQVPLINVPIVNHDNSQHAKDENLRLQNLWDGIELFAGIMTKLGREWRGPQP